MTIRTTTTKAAAAAMLAMAALHALATNALAVTLPPQPQSRYASIVMDAETGNVLYERNADIPRYPASLTKIMTLYLTFEALAAKKIAVGDMLPVSEYAAEHDPSRLDLVPGSKLKVEDAIRAITTKSANDAACVLAERLGGSESRFSEMMTAKGKTLGLKQTTFHNASGLPSEGHLTSARDLALLCKALIRDYPQYYAYFATPAFDFHGTRFPNQNRFLNTYYGADGIKTGFVNASGHNLAASAVRGGKRLIAIVLGGDSQPWTREHAMRLLDVSYAKIDPSLAMVATAKPAPKPEAVATVAAPVQYGTPPATTAIASSTAAAASGPALPLPNATANLAAYAAAASAPKTPAGSVPPPPALPASRPAVAVAKAAAPATARVPVISAPPAAPAPTIAAAPPAPAPEPAAQPDAGKPPGFFRRMIASFKPSHSAEAAQTQLPAAAGAAAPAGTAPSTAAPAGVAATAAPAPQAVPSTATAPAATAVASVRRPETPPQVHPEEHPQERHDAPVAMSESAIASKLAEAHAAGSQAGAAPARAGDHTAKPAGTLPAPAVSRPSAPVQGSSQPQAASAAGNVDESRAASKAASDDGKWSVQVGVFRDATVARHRGEELRSHMPLALRGADLVVGRTGDGKQVASRFARLTEQQAREACSQLQRDRLPCVVVPPGRPLVVATN